ncbi:hypothetical protein BST81_18035 [Leptolyngbya sp. 'hensonii']|uniref:hypothetical protein n=1 Tax=Leptolyngbya sp. 'hensonii' TaxID=1922337 RepID=UPI0009502986|nr:hypothetical protein [Leptolyngbya sp. 'hensonii']OLP16895.1 hypothetical protein BST81_18035 [Leptolyngbya sp. 'hensonii']
MRYLVTTHADRLPTDHQLIMVDGTVPDWTPRPQDLHWDHHRPQGADIQIDEIPLPERDSLLEEQASGEPPCLVTTMVDADACCAAAWVQLPRQLLQPDVIARLQAIAWDCDHLVVPEHLSPWAEFAAKVVVALKRSADSTAIALDLPRDRQIWTEEQWEQYSSTCFQRDTEWLLEAIRGNCPYPGEQGEADHYWDNIETDARSLLQEQRIQQIETARGPIAICQLKQLGRSVDPRSFYRAISLALADRPFRPETLTIRDHRQGGTQYTLACFPLHPQSRTLDYTTGTFDRLTQAERRKNPEAGTWGGRRSVGGSPWNTPSLLSPEEVIALLD